MITTMVRPKSLRVRSRKTGKFHQKNLVKSRIDKASHRKFKLKKRPIQVRMKIRKGVKKAVRTKRTVFGLKVRRRRTSSPFGLRAHKRRKVF